MARRNAGVAMNLRTSAMVAVLHLAGWAGFEAGRHQLSGDVALVRGPEGERALRLSMSELPPGHVCRVGGHVDWAPGWLWPRVLEVDDDSEDCGCDEYAKGEDS